MGKKRRHKRFQVQFDLLEFDGPLAGLWVKVRRTPSDPDITKDLAAIVDLDDAAAAATVLDTFARAFLLDWNADGADGPLPATAEGFGTVDPTVQLVIVTEWFKHLSAKRKAKTRDGRE